ncbi:hypothetical protein [Rhodanobacter sp. DHB23]|uniref:hypothetical protein n=1 Tax=Rhodanobacter sp. DHB23 TaxID=2775923 RepID=UPI00177D86B9|nr:hypothetical protein [Rhodanobacter sp. DHB23]MBD8873866.1 hypothetical protein [Rhodanobacter sp. DHB23]
MGSLRDRVKALEIRAQTNATALLDVEATARLHHWPELILERYADGRLDDLAATLPALQSLLTRLQQAGSAIRFCGRWHPLYRGNDPIITDRAMTRLEAQGDDFAAAAIDHLSTTETHP